MNPPKAVFGALALALAGCGGGGKGDVQMDSVMSEPFMFVASAPWPISAGTAEPTPARTEETPTPTTHSGQWQHGRNPLAWDLQVDLPENANEGLSEERPEGLQAQLDVSYSPEVIDRCTRNQKNTIEAGLRLAFKQWGRHFREHPRQSFDVRVGLPSERHAVTCGGPEALACASARRHLLHQGMFYPSDVIDILLEAIDSDDTNLRAHAQWFTLMLMTHEAGHNVGYNRPGGPDQGFHAPAGSGSIMSHEGTTTKVTSADVRYLGPQAVWRGQGPERFTVWRGGGGSHVESWGMWIDRHLNVDESWGSGPYSPELVLNDEIAVMPFVYGVPSTGASLAGNATWSGHDNFVGFDLDPDWMALLRADADLTYTFANTTMRVDIRNFERFYEDCWRNAVQGLDSDLTDRNYTFVCNAAGCGADVVGMKFYAAGNDPTGYAGGVVNDVDGLYAGAFVAEKE